MRPLKIIKAIDKRLTKFAQRTNTFDENLKNFADNLLYTMEQENGCGLASIQVEDEESFKLKAFENYRAQPSLIIAKSEDKLIVAVNPEIIRYGEETDIDLEGCLSLPGQKNFAKIKRAKSIKVKYNKISGEEITEELNGYIARIFQHECDHNIGILFPNRLEKSREAFFWNKYPERQKT